MLITSFNVSYNYTVVKPYRDDDDDHTVVKMTNVKVQDSLRHQDQGFKI